MMKKKLLSLALVLVLAGAIALPVMAASVNVGGKTLDLGLDISQYAGAASINCTSGATYVSVVAKYEYRPRSSPNVTTVVGSGPDATYYSAVNFTAPSGMESVAVRPTYYALCNGVSFVEGNWAAFAPNYGW